MAESFCIMVFNTIVTCSRSFRIRLRSSSCPGPCSASPPGSNPGSGSGVNILRFFSPEVAAISPNGSDVKNNLFSGHIHKWGFGAVKAECLSLSMLRRTHEHYIRLNRPARDKHSSLLLKLINYGYKKFYKTETWVQCYKTSFARNLRILVIT
jgi:hypothetical protein